MSVDALLADRPKEANSPGLLDAPIFILGIHKSGTSLIRSLLDGTAGLAVLPREPHFFERVGLGVYYPLRPSPATEITELAFRERVRKALQVELDDRNPYSDASGFRGYDPDEFCARGWREGPLTLSSLYARYIDGLWWSVMRERLGALRVVDKSTEYLEFAGILATLFPDASFVQVLQKSLRSPRLVSVLLREGEEALPRLAHHRRRAVVLGLLVASKRCYAPLVFRSSIRGRSDESRKHLACSR